MGAETFFHVGRTWVREMRTETDEELMERFCDGEPAALEALFTRHAGGVQGFLTRMVHDGALAEDLLQTTFLSVVRSRGRYERGTRFAPWLMTIAANAARDALRRRQHREAYTREAPEPPSSAPMEGDPGMRRQLEDALRQLPAEQREAVLLHKLEGWSFEEIASLRGISTSAARVRAHRGYEKLRHLLGEADV
jgi:RNA polymerase sigma factor (sigma-70 family)